MLKALILLLPLIFASPEPQVTWTGKRLERLQISVAGAEESLRTCLAAGLEMRYLYYIEVCSGSSWWFDGCDLEQKLARRLSGDPATGTYRVRADLLDDDQEPVASTYETFDAAAQALSMLDPISLKSLDLRRGTIKNDQYLAVRVNGECIGEYNRTLARISRVLTLGMLRLSGFDTGTVRFRLQRE